MRAPSGGFKVLRNWKLRAGRLRVIWRTTRPHCGMCDLHSTVDTLEKREISVWVAMVLVGPPWRWEVQRGRGHRRLCYHQWSPGFQVPRQALALTMDHVLVVW